MASTDRALWTPTFVAGMVINFFVMVNYYIPMVVVADYAMGTYGASEALAGMVASIFIVGSLISRFTGGALMDALGVKRVLVIGIFAEVVFSALYFFDLGIMPLMVLRFVHGFCYGTASSAVGTAVTATIPDTHKGEGVGYFMLSSTLGTAIGPFVGMAVSQSLGIHGVFGGCLAAAVICAVSLLAFHPNEIKKSAASGPSPRGISAIIEPSTVPIALSACLVFFGYSAVLTFLTPFADQTGLADAASFFFVAYAIAMFASRLVTGKLFDRRGSLIVIVPSFFFAAVGFILVGVAANATVLLVGAALLGLGIGTTQSCGLTIAVQHVSLRRLSYASSTYYAFTDAGVGVGPLVLGALVPVLGYRGLFASMDIVVAVALVWYLFVEWRMRRAQ